MRTRLLRRGGVLPGRQPAHDASRPRGLGAGRLAAGPVACERILRALERLALARDVLLLPRLEWRSAVPTWCVAVSRAATRSRATGTSTKFLWDLGPEGLEAISSARSDALVAAGRRRRHARSAFDVHADAPALPGLSTSSCDAATATRASSPCDTRRTDPRLSQESRVTAPGGGTIVEFPVATYPLLGRSLPVGGGGLLPRLLRACSAPRAAALAPRARSSGRALHAPWSSTPSNRGKPSRRSRASATTSDSEERLPRLERLLTSSVSGRSAKC